MNASPKIRINKLLAEKGVASRREVDTLIQQGRVQLNGVVLKEPGTKIDPEVDQIHVDDVLISLKETEHQYLLLNKPVGYVCSRVSQAGEPTVFDLPVFRDRPKGLKYAGRLDKDTSGLLIMTTDGDFANQITHPSFQLVKKYHVRLRASLSSSAVARLKPGFNGLEDGPLGFLKVKQFPDKKRSYEVWVTEGRNRMVRRIFEAVGVRVEKLHRYALGDLEMESLEEGAIRSLTAAERQKLLDKKS